MQIKSTIIARGGSSISTFMGVGSPKGASHQKHLLVLCLNMQFLTQNQHIITKLPSQMPNYTEQKFHLREGQLWLGVAPALLELPLIIVITTDSTQSVVVVVFITSFRSWDQITVKPSQQSRINSCILLASWSSMHSFSFGQTSHKWEWDITFNSY